MGEYHVMLACIPRRKHGTKIKVIIFKIAWNLGYTLLMYGGVRSSCSQQTEWHFLSYDGQILVNFSRMVAQ